MLSIKFEGLISEKQPAPDNERWQVWRALELMDQDQGQQIAEWFYVVACDQETYLGLSADQNKLAYLTLNTYAEDALVDFAKDKFNKLSFTDWDDFYLKMSEEFIYED